jgi:hypothetical protein
MKKFIITEEEKNRIINLHKTAVSKQYLNEIYEGGLIQSGDELCDIICKDKLAAYGSNGSVVKEIQHALAKCGYNTKYGGGGMNQACGKNVDSCDGKFREQTRDAVKDFQQSNGLKVDGKVGYNTLIALQQEGCIELPDCQCDDQQQQDSDYNFKNPKEIIDNVECEKLKKCVYDYIMIPVPDYIGFNKCLSGEKQSDMDETDYENLEKDGFVEGCSWIIRTNDAEKYKTILSCPDLLNCMPSAGKDMRYCNSKAIKACKEKGCTQITY